MRSSFGKTLFKYFQQKHDAKHAIFSISPFRASIDQEHTVFPKVPRDPTPELPETMLLLPTPKLGFLEPPTWQPEPRVGLSGKPLGRKLPIEQTQIGMNK